jgi:aromatic ring-opening dioxygenase catalytic subunit (LigB family)
MEPPPQWPRDTWDRMATFLRGLAETVGERPKAVLVISGHWETDVPTVNTAERPHLLFDYYGFPEHTYRLTYPASGSPAVATRVRQLLTDAGLETAEEAERGLDHGVFIPFMLVYPGADIPIVQLSLRRDLDPAAHLKIGEALTPLRDEGVLIVGSGMSYHNLRSLMGGGGNDASEAFDGWLAETVEAPNPEARNAGLTRWRQAPGAVESHPREEHLIPLMVAAGAADGDRGTRVYSDRVLGKALSGFRFG